MNTKKNIPEYRVTEFNLLIRDTLESNFGYVRIRGEISELKSASRGQIYITIKDENSILSAVIWESKISSLSIQPEIGMEIIAIGKISTWSRYRTTYQLDIDNIEIFGEGALLKIIEERKKKLFAKGFFDKKNKQLLPFLPTKIGIITSPVGSVIHDIINRLRDRFPVNIDLWPTSVQGNEAPKMIIKAINGFNHKNYIKKPEVIIIARGGGSVEDLMVFNDEELAMAVYESKIPIVSAIGHETDTTIIDFVSDLRASTPTAASELVVPVREELIVKVSICSDRLFSSINHKINLSFDHFNNFIRLLKDPKYIISNYKEKLSIINKNFFNAFQYLIDKKNNQLGLFYLKLKSPIEFLNLKKVQSKNLYKNLNILIFQNIKNISIILNNTTRLLNSNSIDSNLKKGYVLIKKYNKIVKRSTHLKKDDNIQIKFFDKQINIKIKKN